MNKILTYIFVMALVTYAVRMIPFLLFRKKIKSRFVRSVLHYIPYAVLTAMTVPAVFFAAGNVAAAAVGFALAVLTAIWGKGLTTVAIVACAGVYVTDLLMTLL